jgi:hypothetical protein
MYRVSSAELVLISRKGIEKEKEKKEKVEKIMEGRNIKNKVIEEAAV